MSWTVETGSGDNLASEPGLKNNFNALLHTAFHPMMLNTSNCKTHANQEFRISYSVPKACADVEEGYTFIWAPKPKGG